MFITNATTFVLPTVELFIMFLSAVLVLFVRVLKLLISHHNVAKITSVSTVMFCFAGCECTNVLESFTPTHTLTRHLTPLRTPHV